MNTNATKEDTNALAAAIADATATLTEEIKRLASAQSVGMAWQPEERQHLEHATVLFHRKLDDVLTVLLDLRTRVGLDPWIISCISLGTFLLGLMVGGLLL